MLTSIRARLTLIAVACTALVVVGLSVAMTTLLRWQLTDNLDEGLANRAAIIAGLVGDASGALPNDDEDLLIQIVGPDGRITAASANLAGAGPIAPLRPGTRTVGDVPGRAERFRVLTRPLAEPGGAAGFLVVGVNADDVDDPVHIVVRLLAVAVPLVIGTLGALTWALTGRALRPVERMRAEMAAITATDLARRVPEPAARDEIGRLARTMNATLARLDDALRRQQRFVADASHELRGPLTRLRTELEVHLARPDAEDPFAVERSALAEVVGLQDLVDDLLHLARSDAGAVTAAFTTVDLDDIVGREARRLAERGRVRVDTSAVSGAAVRGDPGQLARVVRNLADNAERHAAEIVTFALQEDGGLARLTVADDGAGIPTADRATIFERFSRLDEARSRDHGGAGLGLAIAKEIVERHGGTIAVAAGSPTQFVVELPVSP